MATKMPIIRIQFARLWNRSNSRYFQNCFVQIRLAPIAVWIPRSVNRIIGHKTEKTFLCLIFMELNPLRIIKNEKKKRSPLSAKCLCRKVVPLCLELRTWFAWEKDFPLTVYTLQCLWIVIFTLFASNLLTQVQSKHWSALPATWKKYVKSEPYCRW